jgi:GR25 family glycosyltransferase involved in LPS biosynthesis
MQENHHHHDLNVKKIDKLSPTRVRLTVEYDAGAISRHEASVVNRYTQGAKIPGFRPGKAPVSLIKQKFKEEILRDIENPEKINMENNLKNINIPNYRISAIDGKNNNINNYFQGIKLARKMNNYELACTLSHIKAITFLSKLEGEYFMVLEDDVEFRNINFIKDSLQNIINNCLNFDILMLHKIYIERLNELYIHWNNHIDKLGEDYQIAGASSYIISRSGINKIIDIVKFIDLENFIFDSSYIFDVSDMFLFKNTNTYVYKYNYISVLGIESNIHNDHVIHHNKCEEVQDRYILESFI